MRATVLVIAFLGATAMPSLARAQTAQPVGAPNPDLISRLASVTVPQWISIFGTFIDILQNAETSGSILNRIFNPGSPDLITQIQNVVISELNEERDEDWSSLVTGVSQALQEYVMNPNALDAQDKLIFVDTQSLLLADAMAQRINNPPFQNPPTFQELLRIGPIYNSAIMIHMTALKLEGVAQDTINLRMQDQLQTNFNLVGSAATWCESDGSTPISLWMSKLSQVVGPGIDPQTCYVGQPNPEQFFQIGTNPYNIIQEQEYPQCTLFRGSYESCTFVGQVSCPDPLYWGDYWDFENCPGAVASQMQQCQINAYNSTWNAYYANPVIQVLWASLSNGEEYLEGQSENLAYVSAPDVCPGRLFLGDSD